MSENASVFICYAHADSRWLTRLRVHLKPLEKQLSVKVFSDTDISADEQWRERIREEIEKASIGILLVSADFLASDFITEHELPSLLKGRAEKKKKLLTVFSGESNLGPFPDIANYQGINGPDSPLSSLLANDAEKILVSVSKEVHRASQEFGALVKPVEMPDFNNLPEVDYKLFHNQRSFFEVKVLLPRLVAEIGHENLTGLSFERCLLLGPSIILMRAAHLTYNTFGAANNDVKSMLFTPRSKDIMVGAIDMSSLHLFRCQTDGIGFVDVDGSIEIALSTNE